MPPVRRVTARRPSATPKASSARTTSSAGNRTSRPRRVRLDTDARRAQLLALGMRTFSAKSYDAISIEDLSRAAGVSKGLLYHYFPTKRDFYLAGLKEIARELLAKTLRPVAGGSPVEAVRSAVACFLDHVQGHGPAYVALMRGGVGSDPEVAEVVESTRCAYADHLLRELAGSRLADLSPRLRLAIRGWLGFAEAASLEWLAIGGLTRDQLTAMLVEMMQAILRLEAPTSAR